MNQLSMDMADWNFVPLVRGLARTALRSPSAISLDERRNSPSGISIAFDVCWTRRIQPPRRGVLIPF